MGRRTWLYHTIPYHEVILHRQRVNWAQPASHLIITTVTPSSSSSPTWRTFLNGPHVAQCCAHLGFSSMEFWILCFGSINFCLSPWSWSYISLSFSSLMKSVHAFPPPPPPHPQFNLTMHPPSGSFAAVSIAAKSPVSPLITKVTRLLPLNHDWDITLHLLHLLCLLHRLHLLHLLHHLLLLNSHPAH